MLRRRLIASVLVRDGWAVQSILFRRYLPVGSPEIAVEFLAAWGADEIVLVDISATARRRDPDLALLERVSRKCSVPLAFGGGLRSVEQMNAAIRCGADKVIVNTAVLDDVRLVSDAAKVLGTQCVIASVDVIQEAGGDHRVYRHAERRTDPRSVLDHARALAKAGAGELLVNAVHRDGTKSGFDLALIEDVTRAVDIAVIAQGGAGHPQHFTDVFATAGADAAAAGNFFHFTEHSVTTTKRYLRDRGIDVRLDTQATYAGATFSEAGRVERPSDEELYNRQFTYHPREWI